MKGSLSLVSLALNFGHYQARAGVGMKLLAAILIVLAIGGCAVNPVTGSSELAFVSEAKEIEIGRSNYLPAQQSQGGQYRVSPQLTRYINNIGQQLARVSDRPNLPYEFIVLNSSVPNAWAMPGGKIAVNRGLLLELENEAELAAVLGHEIVHAAARHGAKGIERGMLLQAGAAGIGMAVSDNALVGLMSGVGAQLINQRYGRGQELESDHYGMLYMSRAGYDPSAAISLQEKFVRLSKGKQPDWLQGLFISHPPSQDRVAANIKRTSELPAGGRLGKDEYRRETARMRKSKKAYKLYDEGRKALKEKQYARAHSLAEQAIAIEPEEALFYSLKGNVLVAKQQNKEALVQFRKAISQNSHYFDFYLQQGLAQYSLGMRRQARESLEKSNSLLPTPPAHYFLGKMDLKENKTESAIKHFKTAAVAKSEAGVEAGKQLARLEIPREPGKYVASRAGWDSAGRIVIQLQNRSQLTVLVSEVLVRLVRNSSVVTEERFTININLQPGQTKQLATRLQLPQGKEYRLLSRVNRASVK